MDNMQRRRGAVELRPAGKKYPSVVLTEVELGSVLHLIRTQFVLYGEDESDYPDLGTAGHKLELYEAQDR